MKANNLQQLQKIAKANCAEYQRAYSMIGGKAYGVSQDGTYIVGEFGDYGLSPRVTPKKNEVVIQ